jgi:ABC-type multidrug transport system fused ATPase/permease subunit
MRLILILDEPTSGLDPASEKLLLRALANLVEGRTTFVIAHRMSTVAQADQVIVLDRGRIVEHGTHDELMRLPDGLYRSFLELQLGHQPVRRHAVRRPRLSPLRRRRLER